ncbi:hypothetical protein [Sphingomonas sp. Ant H11]|uniref:hypothetical protein n=1 Tax=Sphingomonas sp. Ant H11 TaxID=1564113 RepID=UPI00053D6C7B|nr:hypothetical protein [Sphingomonas sp. Ant H11]
MSADISDGTQPTARWSIITPIAFGSRELSSKRAVPENDNYAPLRSAPPVSAQIILPLHLADQINIETMGAPSGKTPRSNHQHPVPS